MSEIVISGFSGKYPECENVEEFADKLFSGVDMVGENDRRWPVGFNGLPTRNGTLKDLSRFDAAFFGVNPKQADALDPQIRLLVENTYEAIVDAGFNPVELRGKNIGVFVGQTANEALDLMGRNSETQPPYGITGSNRAMTANRISFSFDFKGPSLSVDTACSSSLVALHLAVTSMERGEIDGAIVAGVNILLTPATSLYYHRLNMLSVDGKCRSFDSSGTGYVRSETTGAFFLQQADQARRVYATVLATGSNVDGHKEMGITYPSGSRQQELIEEVLSRGKISPLDVSYFESHGTGTKVGDPQEVNAIHKVFCQSVKRQTPLLLGAVKSNIGHAESAAAIGQLSKVLLAMERKTVPGNLHFVEPHPEIPGLKDGSIKVVNSNQPWEGGIASINSFGFGGANAHVVLKANSKTKKNQRPVDHIPQLLACSGRNEEAVNRILDKGAEFEEDNEFLSLLREVYKTNTPNHTHRGFRVSGDSHTTVEAAPAKKEVWFLFSGMGSQWVGMGRDLMKLKLFEDSIAICAKTLETVGVDLVSIIEGKEALSITNTFIGIAAIQVALVDVLRALGVEPDGILGHSAGEVGCAYADGGFTAEETVLIAHSRGVAIENCNITGGGMVAVGGLTWEQVKAKLPEGVHAACHNSVDSVTVAGESSKLKSFVTQLEAEGITARPVDSMGIAFHTPFVHSAGPQLIEAIRKINPKPKPRSPRWVSSCLAPSTAREPWAQLNSAEYHGHNVTSPVLFKEAVDRVPAGAVVIEIAPHALLGGLVKRAVSGAQVLALTKKNVPDPVTFFLRTVGKLYNCGVAVNLNALYPKVEYPVSLGTPIISSLIKWNHSDEWQVPLEAKLTGGGPGMYEQVVDLKKEEHSFLIGHTIDGRILFPATGLLTLAWKAFAKMSGCRFDELPVVISDVHIHKATVLSGEGPVKLTVNLSVGDGRFEILDETVQVATGKIVRRQNEQYEGDAPVASAANAREIAADELYKELRLRRYEYSGAFLGMLGSSQTGSTGLLRWTDNWITFMDTMLQFDIAGNNTRELYLPVCLGQVIIDPLLHKKLTTKAEIAVSSSKQLPVIRSGGIEISHLKTNHARKRPLSQAAPVLERHVFVPYINDQVQGLEDAVTCSLQIVLENSDNSVKLKTVEIDAGQEELLSPLVARVLAEEPNLVMDMTVASQRVWPGLTGQGIKVDSSGSPEDVLAGSGIGLVLGANLLCGDSWQWESSSLLRPKAFLLTLEDGQDCLKENGKLKVAASFPLSKTRQLLLYRRQPDELDVPEVLNVDETDLSWVTKVQTKLKTTKANKTLVLQNCRSTDSGLLGFIRCLRKEDGCQNVRVMLTNGKIAAGHPKIEDQLKRGLSVNVFAGGQWGSYRHLKLQNAQPPATEHAVVDTLVRGDLSSLRWIASPRPGDSLSEMCTVYFTPLNFRDIMIATGKLPPDALPGNLTGQDCLLGLEFAGRDSTGQRVVGIVESRGLASTVAADPVFLWPVPDKWTLQEASSVPIAYATAYYALIVRGRLCRGESVLVHAGSGGVGQAAITIALNLGCKVFTTVGTLEKKEYLLQRFDKLDSSSIGNSRDASFEWLVLNETSGRGVDVVLNSLAGEQLRASVRCLANGGRFLEIGKADLSSNSPLGMSVFLKNTTFHGILLDALFRVEADNKEKVQVARLLRDGLASGEVRPLPVTLFQSTQLEEAFRFMATGKHIGKVVLKVRHEEPEKLTLSNPQLLTAENRAYMSPTKSYILVGGLGGFGLELAEWLVSRGAANLILTSRSGVTTGFQELCLRRWRAKFVRVDVRTDDCSTELGTVTLIDSANRIAPVGGIFNLAGVLSDELFSAQTPDNFQRAVPSKVNSTRWLDVCSRASCPQLDLFVAFSSISSGRGNAGQANYGYANSAMEQICLRRRQERLPALAVQWGAVGDVGMVITKLGGNNDTRVVGTLPQKIQSCLSTLNTLLTLGYRAEGPAVVGSFVLADKLTGALSSTAKGEPAHLSISSIVANIIGIRDSKQAGDATLSELGMDSLMSTEIRQILEINLDIVMTQGDIRNLTFPKLEELGQKSELSKK